jgi:3-deoxy-manno-octulosonate cytidylyltransferase (CMP-KDO synthetase)
VFNSCLESGFDTYVLTDDKRVADLIPNKQVYIDKEDYENGTERCAGAVLSRQFNDYERFINVQGDMPDVTVEMIQKVSAILEYYSIATLYTQMPEDKLNDPNTVKLIRSNDQCLWFARGISGYGDWHLGVYGYTKKALESYIRLDETREERIEKLEQLRWLKNGWQMGVLPIKFEGTEINTPEDVHIWNQKK